MMNYLEHIDKNELKNSSKMMTLMMTLKNNGNLIYENMIIKKVGF